MPSQSLITDYSPIVESVRWVGFGVGLEQRVDARGRDLGAAANGKHSRQQHDLAKEIGDPTDTHKLRINFPFRRFRFSLRT